MVFLRFLIKLIFILFALTSAENYFKTNTSTPLPITKTIKLEDLLANSDGNNAESIKETFKQLNVTITSLETLDGTCLCDNLTCICCAIFKLRVFEIYEKVCISISYLPKEIGFSLSLIIDDKTVYTDKISASNPPPICFDLARIPKIASICIKFHDLLITRNNIHGCIAFQIQIIFVTIFNIKLGCFDMKI